MLNSALTGVSARTAAALVIAAGMLFAAQPARACEIAGDWWTIEDLLNDNEGVAALTLATRCVAQSRQEHGRAAPETALYLNLLGRAQRALDQPAAAEVSHLEAIAILVKGPHDDELSQRYLESFWHWLAELYKATEQHRKAIKALKEKMKLLDEDGSDAFARVLAWMSIGDSHLELGDRRAAERAYLAGIEAVPQVPLQIRDVPLFVHRRLARLYRFEERFSESEAVLQAGLAQMESIYGTEDEGSVFFYEALGWTYYFQFRYQESEAMADKALAYYGRNGNEVPDAPVRAMTLKARLLDNRPWKASEALALLAEALALRRTVDGTESLVYANGLSELVEHHLKRRNFEKAEALARAAIPIYQRYFDAGALWVGRSHQFIAQALHGQGKDAEALPFALKAHEIQRETLPPYHSVLGETLSLLSEIHKALGQMRDYRAIRAEIANYYQERTAFMSGSD